MGSLGYQLIGFDVLDEYGLLVKECSTEAQAEAVIERRRDNGWFEDEIVPVWG